MGIAVLASGTGSILNAFLEEEIPVDVVAADRKCKALELAQQAGIPAVLVERVSFGKDFDRTAYTEQLVKVLAPYQVSLIAMAGFGTVLAQPVHQVYGGRILNTHPALLPAFKGWHAVQDALDAGVKVTGCTVHVATLEVDDGPILAQEPVRVEPGDTVETLHERIKRVERRLYPETVQQLLRSEALAR